MATQTALPYAPFFGLWRLALAGRKLPYSEQFITNLQRKPLSINAQPQFLKPETLPRLFVFDADTQPNKTLAVNKLDNQALVWRHERASEEWR